MRLCLPYNPVPLGAKPEFCITNPLQNPQQACASNQGGLKEAVSGLEMGKGGKSILYSPTGYIKVC